MRKRDVLTGKAELQLATVRLSSDETRLLLKAVRLRPDPVFAYKCRALADLGLMELVDSQHTDELLPLRKQLRAGAMSDTVEQLIRLTKTMGKLSRKAQEQAGYVLTPFGEEVAKGIHVCILSA